MVHVSLIFALASLLVTNAVPTQQVFDLPQQIDPLKHLSAISPFFIPAEQPTPLPYGHTLERVSILIRHSAILGNDDEYEQTMGPFIRKIQDFGKNKLPSEGPWAFLRDWETPIIEDDLEKISDRGKKDAKFLGKYVRKQYGSLFPPVDKKPSKSKDKKKKTPPYKVWTASSERDIDTAEAYIRGSFPSHQSGDHGEGDGEVVQLIKVPNKAKDWDRSLTPHKACSAWEKDSALIPAGKWLSVYAPKVRERLAPLLGDLSFVLNDQDILAMQMLCGYESIAVGDSPFCHLFTDEEWLDVEYYFDIRWYHCIGYGSHFSPYLGMPWVKTALHLLDGKDTEGGEHFAEFDDYKHKLPAPKLPPNATHTQFLHPSFTHRESPAFVAVFLNLYNSTSLEHPASEIPPLDHRPLNRAWRTSHLISFLGHVSLERFKDNESKTSYVRAMVNGKQEVMGGCEDGVHGSCKWKTFKSWVDGRVEEYKDWESICEPKKEIGRLA